MRFTTTTLSAIAAFLSFASANTVEFVNQDATNRTLVFTGNPGMADLPKVPIPGNKNVTVTFPSAWVGNWYSFSEGSPDVAGMLGEIAWDAWNGINFFDVSAIVDPKDANGVKIIYPKIARTPLSGCQTFPCANCYNQPDDLQTMSTTEKDLVCLIGNLPAPKLRRHPRHFVEGH